MSLSASDDPPVRLFDRRLYGGPAGVGRDADVKGHDDICTETLLMANRRLGGEFVSASVDVGLEDNCVVGDLPEMFEAKALEAAAVRQYRAVPLHEAVKPAQGFDDLDAGSRDIVDVVLEKLRSNETIFLHPNGIDVECDEARNSIPAMG